jgi:peptide/nickel transport system permease protein
MTGSVPLFILRRLAGIAVVAVAVAALTFLVLHGLFPETFTDTRPLFVELWHFLVQTFVHLDLGESTTRPLGEVEDLIFRGLAADTALVIGGTVVGLALGAAGGALAERHPRGPVARLLDVLAILALCTPVYVIGMAGIFVFAPDIGAPLPFFLFETHTYVPLHENPLQWLQSLVVPWVVTGLPLAALCLRMTRASLRETAGADFVRTARAKGLRSLRVTTRHTLPVAMPPVVSLAGAYLPLLIGNVLLVEKVFSIPGAYKLVPNALDLGNYAIIQGLLLVTAVFVVVANGLVDLALALLDPRVRSSSAR